MSHHAPDRTPSADEIAFVESFALRFEDKLKADADRNSAFLAALTQPAKPLPPVDLANPTERRLALITLLGYVAGLAGSRNPNPFFDLAAKAWANGWRQGREHRARAIERNTQHDIILTAPKIKAMMIRMEPVP